MLWWLDEFGMGRNERDRCTTHCMNHFVVPTSCGVGGKFVNIEVFSQQSGGHSTNNFNGNIILDDMEA